MQRVVARGFAGHSKWANIRHKKGGADQARGDLFAKLAKQVEVSSRLANGDRAHSALASSIARAKDARTLAERKSSRGRRQQFVATETINGLRLFRHAEEDPRGRDRTRRRVDCRRRRRRVGADV